MFKMLKNQKGMTLVELLAVMVIVGIIAAISIPAIGGLLENTRKDAYISNATAVQESARLFVVSNEAVINENGGFPILITGTPNATTTDIKTDYTWVVKANSVDKTSSFESFDTYVENLVDPHNKNALTEVKILIEKDVDGQYTYKTTVKGQKYQTPAVAVDARNLTRATLENVTNGN